MTNWVSRIADMEDVDFLYEIILGRSSESVEMVQQMSGRPLIPTIAGFLASTEMKNLAEHVVASGRLPHIEWLPPQHLK